MSLLIAVFIGAPAWLGTGLSSYELLCAFRASPSVLMLPFLSLSAAFACSSSVVILLF